MVGGQTSLRIAGGRDITPKVDSMGENLSIVPAVESTPAPVRLLLVDDHQVVLEGLTSMLASQSDRVTIAATTTDAHEALRLAAERQPDVLLLDVRLRG